MFLQTKVLSEEEREQVHRGSIRVLEEVGVKYPSERALSLLEKNGAKIDWDNQIAFISEAMVKKALDSAPNEFTLGGRNPDYDLKLPTNDTIINLDGAGIWTYDYELGKRRKSTTQDIADAARVFNEVEMGNLVWASVSPTEGDVPPEAESILDMDILFNNYTKHVQDEVKDPREVPLMVEMLKTLLGSEEEIKRRHIYSVVYCTIAPLANEFEMMEATMDLSHYDVPILAFPMPAAGSTGPASLFSNLVMNNAETLSIFVLFQCESPGVPIIFGSAAGITNRRSGVLLEGAVETTLINAAMTEMAEYYGGFPTEMAGCLSDSKVPGRQAAIEKTLSSLPFHMNKTDIIQGLGLFEASMTLSLEQILIDDEIGKMCQKICSGIDFSEEKDFFDDIKEVGPTGHFLKQKNTKTTFRSGKEYFNPLLGDRSSFEEWEEIGSPDMYETAHKRVKEILASDVKDPIPLNVQKEMKEIVEESRKVFGE